MTAANPALSYDSAPSFATPLRFFLTAPLFGVAAGLLLMLSPELLESRWTPGALALTHLIAVGFMLMVMVGALFQILPVVAGASVPYSGVLATLVHLGLTSGAITLTWGLGSGDPAVLPLALTLLGGSFALFLSGAAYGLAKTPIAQATPRDLRIAMMGFGIAVMLGLILAMAVSGEISIPLVMAVKLHVGWAWLGGSGILLAAASWVVVPMFQITPSYPLAMTRYWAIASGVALMLWSAAVYAGLAAPEIALLSLLLALSASFAVATLRLQQKSRRSTPDTTTRAFQLGMSSLLAGLGFVLASHFLDDNVWPILAGILVLHGCFVSVIIGMLYKIVPFLAWLHLTQDKGKAPNMKKLLPDTPTRRQLIAHASTLAVMLAAAASGLPMLGRIAGALLVIESAWLLRNLYSVVRAYRAAQSA